MGKAAKVDTSTPRTKLRLAAAQDVVPAAPQARVSLFTKRDLALLDILQEFKKGNPAIEIPEALSLRQIKELVALILRSSQDTPVTQNDIWNIIKTNEFRSRVDDLNWPTEKYENSNEYGFHKRFAIITFLRRVWVPFIERTGVVVTRKALGEVDSFALSALNNYLKYRPLPDDIPIITTKELGATVAGRPTILKKAGRTPTHG